MTVRTWKAERFRKALSRHAVYSRHAGACEGLRNVTCISPDFEECSEPAASHPCVTEPSCDSAPCLQSSLFTRPSFESSGKPQRKTTH